MTDRKEYRHRVKNAVGEIERNHNSPQELWVGLHDSAIVNCGRRWSGLLRNAEDFYFVVFDCLNSKVSQAVREQSVICIVGRGAGESGKSVVKIVN